MVDTPLNVHTCTRIVSMTSKAQSSVPSHRNVMNMSGFLSGFFIREKDYLNIIGGQSSTRGVWGHAPLGNFGILD